MPLPQAMSGRARDRRQAAELGDLPEGRASLQSGFGRDRRPSSVMNGRTCPDCEFSEEFMSESYIQNLFSERIGGKSYGKGTEIYKFEKIKRAKRAALAANPGAELIDMGVGEPDEMAFPECIE